MFPKLTECLIAESNMVCPMCVAALVSQAALPLATAVGAAAGVRQVLKKEAPKAVAKGTPLCATRSKTALVPLPVAHPTQRNL